MNTIYFHIGLPKTGTSYLQTAFCINAEKYLDFNLFYPDFMANFVKAASGETTSGNGYRIAASSGIERLKHIPGYDVGRLSNELDQNRNYLISSEWFSRCPPHFFEEINNILSKKFKVQYIAAIRNPADQIFSEYLQGLKTSMFSEDIDLYVDYLILQNRQMLSLIAHLSDSIKIINYDVHKKNLLAQFDHVVFGHSVSREPKSVSVNPSPNRHQAEILKLVNKLKLSDFAMAMKYLENTQSNFSGEAGFKVSKSISVKIFDQLKSEIDNVNKMLPFGEKIENRFNENVQNISDSPFTHSDVEFLRGLIKKRFIHAEADCDWIIKWSTGIESSSLAQLPSDFNVVAYLLRNPDITRKRVDPIRHYLNFGHREGRRYK
jgi:hypothetical protein